MTDRNRKDEIENLEIVLHEGACWLVLDVHRVKPLPGWMKAEGEDACTLTITPLKDVRMSGSEWASVDPGNEVKVEVDIEDVERIGKLTRTKTQELNGCIEIG